MKNLLKPLLILAVMAISVPSKSGVTPTATSAPISRMDLNETARLTNRLNEIQAMDKNSMSASEKKALRKELRAIKKVQSSSNGGIYLSVGAIIIIILLLILLI